MTLFIISFFGDFIRGLAQFAAPIVAAYFHATDAEIGWVSAAYGITYCCVPPMAGKLSDKIGRKKSLLMAFLLYIIASLVYIQAKEILTLITAAAMEGIALSFLWPAVGSLLVELSTPQTKQRNTDIYMTMWNLGAIGGPFVAGFVFEYWGATVTFLVDTAICIFAIILIFGFLKVERIPRNEKENLSSDNNKERRPTLSNLDARQKKLLYFFAYGMVILSAFYLAILLSYYAGFAVKHLSISESIAGIITFFLPIGRGISFAIMSKFNHKAKLNLSPIFTFCMVFLILLIPMTTNLFIVCILFAAVGFFSGFGFSGGFSIITDISDKNNGLYTGIAEAMVGISFFLSPILPFLFFGETSAYSPFWFGAIIMGFLSVTFFIIRIQLQKMNSSVLL